NEVEAATHPLGVETIALKIQQAADIAPAFEALKDRAEALYVVGEALTSANQVRINSFALAARLPTMHPNRERLEAGGLMSYGPNFASLYRRAGDFVDKILRGAKPADIPVEQPTKFDFVINLTTAKAIGLNRWGAGDPELFRRHASELVALAPDVILAVGGAVVPSLLQATRTVPIVFTGTPDPVGAGFVESLARPGGNATGFTIFEYGTSGKWLELLKEIAPHVTRAAVIRDPAIAAGLGQWGAIQSVAPSLGVELRPLGVRDAGEIERVVTAFARSSNGGLIVTGSTLAVVHRELITTLAARHRLPAVYPLRLFVTVGGLIS